MLHIVMTICYKKFMFIFGWIRIPIFNYGSISTWLIFLMLYYTLFISVTLIKRTDE